MNIVTNESLIRRNGRIGQVTMLAGLAVLGGGMVINFKMPNQFALSLGALLIGFALSQVGIYYSNRWGRSPRPDELLNQALKGLDGRYTLYHWSTAASHLLLGPAGVWLLFPKSQSGTISYSKGRWRQRGGNWYLQIFAQEGFGRPDIEIADEARDLKKFLSKHLPEDKLPVLNSAVVLTNTRATIAISDEENPPAETIVAAKLKEVIRKAGKARGLSPEKLSVLQEALGEVKGERTSEPTEESSES